MCLLELLEKIFNFRLNSLIALSNAYQVLWFNYNIKPARLIVSAGF